MSFNTILNIIRFVCLFFFCLALFLLYVWKFEEPFIDRMGNKIVSAYTSIYQSRLDDALSSLKNNSDQGILQLNRLLVDLETVKKGDRLAPIKIKTLESLISAQEDKGELVNALSTAEKWSAFDNRDLFGQFILARLLLKTSGRDKEGVQILRRVNQLSPSNPMFSSLYAEILLQENKLVEAFLSLRRSLKTSEVLKGLMWQIFWDTGDGFSSHKRKSFYPTIDEDGKFKIHFSLPASVRKLRIDLPPHIHMILETPVLMQRNNTGQKITNLLTLSLQFNQMTQIRNILKTSGENDPYFFWDLPNASNGEFIDYVFSANVHEEMPSVIYDLLGHPEADSLKTLLDAADEKEASEQLFEVKKKIARQSEYASQILKAQKLINIQNGRIELFWSHGKKPFSEQRKKGLPFTGIIEHDQLLFNFSIKIESPISQLRIAFPEGFGVEYSIDDVRIYMDGNIYQINVGQINTIFCHGLKKDGNRFTTIGADPYFYFSFPGSSGTVEKVGIQGRAQ